MVGQASRSETETRNVLDPDAVATAMDEPPMPGSRVRATTKHGTLTVDEIAAMQPGMARLMDELSRRYWVLYYAAKAGNWELAAYMERESEKSLQTASAARCRGRDPDGLRRSGPWRPEGLRDRTRHVAGRRQGLGVRRAGRGLSESDGTCRRARHQPGRYGRSVRGRSLRDGHEPGDQER